MDGTFAVFAYLGPETMLPMTSVVAGAAGVVLMFGRNSIRWMTRSTRLVAARWSGPGRGPGRPKVATIRQLASNRRA